VSCDKYGRYGCYRGWLLRLGKPQSLHEIRRVLDFLKLTRPQSRFGFDTNLLGRSTPVYCHSRISSIQGEKSSAVGDVAVGRGRERRNVERVAAGYRGGMTGRTFGSRQGG
jgi:hypothetical protein